MFSTHSGPTVRAAIAATLLALVASLLVMVPQAAAQTLVVVDGTAGCGALGGEWTAGTCTLDQSTSTSVVVVENQTVAIPAGVTLDLIGRSLRIDDGAELNSAGTINIIAFIDGTSITDGRLGSYGTGVINNTGLITDPAVNGSQPIASFDNSTFNNSGTITLPDGQVYVRSGSTFNNSGTITADGLGYLNTSSGRNTGTVNVRFLQISSPNTVVNDCGTINATREFGTPIAEAGSCFEDPSNCLESEFARLNQLECFATVNNRNILDTPMADPTDLGELRTRVVYEKLQLARARSTVVTAKNIRLQVEPQEYMEASITLAQLRAQVQILRGELADSRAAVQAARPPVAVG